MGELGDFDIGDAAGDVLGGFGDVSGEGKAGDGCVAWLLLILLAVPLVVLALAMLGGLVWLAVLISDWLAGR